MSASAFDDKVPPDDLLTPTPAGRFRWFVFAILRGGAIIASLLLSSGMFRYASVGKVMPVDSRLQDPVRTVAFLLDLRYGDPLALCTLGVLVLVGLPIARVMLSFFHFVQIQDRLYVLLTGVVLALVLVGALLGRAL